jgi:hypothetical protein
MLEEWQESRQVSIVLQKAIVEDLNRVLTKPSIWDEVRFSDVKVRYEILELLERNPAGADVARLNRLLLENAFPQELARNINWRFAGEFAKWIHQLGLEVPPPYNRKSKPSAPTGIYANPNSGPYWWRLASDQKTNSNWRIVLGAYEEWKRFIPQRFEPQPDPCYYDPFQLFKALSFAIEKGEYSSELVARAAFRLALKYGWTGLAEKLLRGFQSTRVEFLDFCHHLKRVQQSCPFGIDDAADQHPAWRDALKRSWSSILQTDPLSASNLLPAHEILVGRTVELTRWRGGGGAATFVRKYNDLVSEDEIRETVSNNWHPLQRGAATVSLENVAGFLNAASSSALGPPVCVSMVRLPGDRISFLVVGKSEHRWVACTEKFPGLGQELETLNDTRENWLKLGSQDLPEPPIDWDQQFKRLCECLANQVQKLNDSCGWVMLALESDLAELPWQDLVRRYWRGKSSVFVSLIPNFGWASRSYQDLFSFPKTKHNASNLSKKPEFEEFRSQIESDLYGKAPALGSTAVFLGHGKHENGFTTVEAETGLLGRGAWLDIGNYRLVMVHSCSAGRLQGGFLGDLGGVPAMALATGCRLICAPVTEVPLRTARVLHKWHVQKDVPREFGYRYMQALAEDPWVGAYACYGFGSQFVTGQNYNSPLG